MDDLESSNNPAKLMQIVNTIENPTQFKGFILGTNSGLFKGVDLNALKRIHYTVDSAMK